jgi:hypothetical protein
LRGVFLVQEIEGEEERRRIWGKKEGTSWCLPRGAIGPAESEGEQHRATLGEHSTLLGGGGEEDEVGQGGGSTPGGGGGRRNKERRRKRRGGEGMRLRTLAVCRAPWVMQRAVHKLGQNFDLQVWREGMLRLELASGSSSSDGRGMVRE